MALHVGAAARAALLIAKPHVDPRRRVMLLAPVPAVVVEPGVDCLLVWREDLALGPAPLRGLGRRVLHPGVLPDRRLRRSSPQLRGHYTQVTRNVRYGSTVRAGTETADEAIRKQRNDLYPRCEIISGVT